MWHQYNGWLHASQGHLQIILTLMDWFLDYFKGIVNKLWHINVMEIYDVMKTILLMIYNSALKEFKTHHTCEALLAWSVKCIFGG